VSLRSYIVWHLWIRCRSTLHPVGNLFGTIAAMTSPQTSRCNMVYQQSQLPEGVLVPTLCFFKEGPKQEVDLETVGKHAVR
jgi:hypothetical protein